ncbi:MAG TPA: hypothetical protein VGF76_23250 [Polyangiaceae bacterium]|jgi:hypothetical protein
MISILRGTRGAVALIALIGVTLGACQMGPSEERLGCLNGCASAKDQCMLNAMTAQGIQACDFQARRCTEPCPQ